jgi:hypothetical protein
MIEAETNPTTEIALSTQRAPKPSVEASSINSEMDAATSRKTEAEKERNQTTVEARAKQARSVR